MLGEWISGGSNLRLAAAGRGGVMAGCKPDSGGLGPSSALLGVVSAGAQDRVVDREVAAVVIGGRPGPGFDDVDLLDRRRDGTRRASGVVPATQDAQRCAVATGGAGSTV
jgi:hypothetical protein